MSDRFTLRRVAEDMPWEDHAELIRDALPNRCVVSFWLCRGTIGERMVGMGV